MAMSSTFSGSFAGYNPADLSHLVLEISQELKEPLRTIRCCAEVAEERWGAAGADVNQLLKCVTAAAKRMQMLIDDGLALVLTGGATSEKSPVDLRHALHFAISNLREEIVEGEAMIHSGGLPTVAANFGALVQVFQNLIANAIQYRAEQPPRIDVDCARSGADWIVSVADNGIGIKPEYREQIFLPLKRLHAEAECSGTGLGLAICRRIVEFHHGRIWVESQPGAGSTFYFTLPADSRELLSNCQ
jgi:chemotaxis family two-component system sensor kinase Cph1